MFCGRIVRLIVIAALLQTTETSSAWTAVRAPFSPSFLRQAVSPSMTGAFHGLDAASKQDSIRLELLTLLNRRDSRFMSDARVANDVYDEVRRRFSLEEAERFSLLFKDLIDQSDFRNHDYSWIEKNCPKTLTDFWMLVASHLNDQPLEGLSFLRRLASRQNFKLRRSGGSVLADHAYLELLAIAFRHLPTVASGIEKAGYVLRESRRKPVALFERYRRGLRSLSFRAGLEVGTDIYHHLKGRWQIMDGYGHTQFSLFLLHYVDTWDARDWQKVKTILDARNRRFSKWGMTVMPWQWEDFLCSAVSHIMPEIFLFPYLDAMTRLPPWLADPVSTHFLALQAMHAVTEEAGKTDEHIDVRIVCLLLNHHADRLKDVRLSAPMRARMQRNVARAMVYYSRFAEVQEELARHPDLEVLTWFDDLATRDRITSWPVLGATQGLGSDAYRSFGRAVRWSFSQANEDPHSPSGQNAWKEFADLEVVRLSGEWRRGERIFRDRLGNPISEASIRRNLYRSA